MHSRKKVKNARKDKAIFTKTADRTRKKNLTSEGYRIMRGGIRM